MLTAVATARFDTVRPVHPCVRINGIGRGPRPGLRMKCTGTRATLTW